MRGAALAGLVLFWLGSAAAGVLAPGYSARADYVSSLAGRGSEVAPLGIAALLVLALGHLAAGAAVGSVAGTLLGLAGVCGLVVAAFRTACPLGAAGCGTAPNDAPADPADVLHVAGVAGYQVAVVGAMLALALRWGRGWPAALTVAAAVASVLLVVRIDGPDLGLDQRLWLVVTTGWVAVAALRGVGGRVTGVPVPGRRRRGDRSARPWR